MKEVENKIIEILENKNINPILSGDPTIFGTIRIYEEEKVEEIVEELESLFKEYKSYLISYTHVNPCCSPSYDEIRYKTEV